MDWNSWWSFLAILFLVLDLVIILVVYIAVRRYKSREHDWWKRNIVGQEEFKDD